MSARILIQHLHDRRTGVATAAALPATTTFLAPSGCPSGRHLANGVWAPTGDSIASRRPPARSRGFCRGSVVDFAANRALVYESGLERDFACMLMADRRVVRIHDQPPAVVYETPDGHLRKHTFDFLVTLRDGLRVAFAVKPSVRVGKSGIEDVLALVRRQAPKGFADRFLLRTEQHITKDRAFNARWILRARRGRNQTDVAAMAERVATLNGRARLADIVTASGLGARGRNALVCLIDEGAVELETNNRIGDGSFVRRPTAPQC